jgi:hypothetical protein
LSPDVFLTNIWTLPKDKPQPGTWEGDWMKKSLPLVNGKSPWSILVYWGSIGINSKEYSGDLYMFLLKQHWSEIYLKPDTRIMAIYTS